MSIVSVRECGLLDNIPVLYNVPKFAVRFHPLHVPITGVEGREYLLSIAIGEKLEKVCANFIGNGCFGFFFDGR
jgi:hypothetical protein